MIDIPAAVAIGLPIVLVTLLVVLIADELINWNARRVVAKECL